MKELQKRLKKNLAILEKRHSSLVYQLTTADPSPLEYCQTDQGELNLKRTYQGKTYYYHSPAGALAQAHEWFHKLDKKDATILYVYGIGLGYYYEAAHSWLRSNKNHTLVFLEEDLGVLYRLLETESGTRILKDPQVQLIYFRDLITDKALFNELSWTYISCPFTVSCLQLYADVNPTGFLELQHQLSHEAVQKKIFVEEYFNYGIVFFRNFYKNILEWPHAYLGNGLFNQFKQVPAIICGAGPSLEKNGHLLQSLTDRALIFAGGSALNAVLAKGVKPHFGAGIDPNQAQYERLLKARPQQLPFFYRNRFFHDALKIILGPKLYLTGSGGYETASWFEQKLGIEGENLDEGHNIVNFCLEIAQALGCNPIILVGVDLSFTSTHFYAEGVVDNPDLSKEQLTQATDFDSQPLLKEDIYGQPIYTLWKWISEAEWISEFAQNHPELTIINATEGGLGFKGVANQPLAEVADQYLQSSENLYERVQTELQKHSLSYLKRKHLINLLKDLQRSLDHCIHLFDLLLNEARQVANQVKKGLPFPLSLQTANGALLEMEMEETDGYRAVLETFNVVYLHFHHRLIKELLSPKRRLSEKRINLKKIELQIHRLTFLKDVARVNTSLISHTLDDLSAGNEQVNKNASS